MPRTTVNLQREFLPVENFQSLLDVGDADARTENLHPLTFRDPHAVVDNLNRQPSVVALGTKGYGPAFNLGPDTVSNGVFDQGLQDHARDNHLQRFGVDVLADLELVTPKAYDLDIKVVVDKI